MGDRGGFEFRRQSQKVFVDNGDVVLRLHRTDIVRVRTNGDVILSTGGWATPKTMSSMNDALELFGMWVECAPGSKHANQGRWQVTDSDGSIHPYTNTQTDFITTIKSKGPEDRVRAEWLASAYKVPYKPAPAPAAATAPGPRIASAQPAPAAAAPAAARANGVAAAPAPAARPSGTGGSWANVARPASAGASGGAGTSQAARVTGPGAASGARVTGPGAGAAAPAGAAAAGGSSGAAHKTTGPPGFSSSSSSSSGGWSQPAAHAAPAGPSSCSAAAAAAAAAGAMVTSAPPRPSGNANVLQAFAGLALNEPEDDSHLCVVCMEEPRSIVLVPCGHMALCKACGDEIVGRKKANCPICCQPVEYHVEVDQ